MPESPININMEHHELAPGLTICRVLNGMWQVAGGHGYIDRNRAIKEMKRYHDSGFTTWDLADIYGPAEDFVGEFRRGLPEHERQKMQALTKSERMQVMKDTGLRIVSNQVQYSIVDRRPEVKMAQFCKENNSSLLAYGTICGGLMSERYLGRPEPSLAELDTLSLKKYKRMIDAWGGWELFQELLSTLKGIAGRHNASIANVATRYILDRPAVAGVIIGARLGIADHRDDNARVFGFSLDGQDREEIEGVCAKSNDLFEAIGDCGDEYR
jgi:aryl-alcohol dehydrogenase-like predicted oxidoreductase